MISTIIDSLVREIVRVTNLWRRQVGEGEVALVVCLSPGRLLREVSAALCLWAGAWGGCFGETRWTAAGASALASASQSCWQTEH